MSVCVSFMLYTSFYIHMLYILYMYMYYYTLNMSAIKAKISFNVLEKNISKFKLIAPIS